MIETGGVFSLLEILRNELMSPELQQRFANYKTERDLVLKMGHESGTLSPQSNYLPRAVETRLLAKYGLLNLWAEDDPVEG